MDEGKIEECMKSLFDSLIANERAESHKLIKNALDQLKQSGFDFTDPEDFNGYLVYKLNNGLTEIARTMHGVIENGIKDEYKPNFIYTHYDFLEHSLKELCVLREGSSCCADKSRAILRMYLTYSLTGNLPEFNPNVEHYWIPKFGTYEQWLNLCDGLYELYYGKTEQYFKAYHALIQAEIRRYKHTLHTWYIKFKDGEIIKFDTTWDDEQKNPLDNEYFDKGDFYVISKSLVSKKGYEAFEDKDSIRRCCKVPKSEIDEIYKISEEKMV